MNTKTRYLLSMLCLAVVVALATTFVRRQSIERAEARIIKEKVALVSDVVGNQNQLTQVVTIQQQVRKRQPLNDQQVGQLVAVVSGPPDPILQAKSLATLNAVARLNSLSAPQKTKVVAAVIGALKSPEVLVRHSAASVLGRLEDQSAVPALLPLLNDADENVRASTKKALERLQKSAPTPGR